MTFFAFCDKHKTTAAERKELAWYLAFLRLRRTIEALALIRV